MDTTQQQFLADTFIVGIDPKDALHRLSIS
jgi:hypothetical protein